MKNNNEMKQIVKDKYAEIAKASLNTGCCDTSSC